MGKVASKARESRVNIQISDRLRGGAEPELPFRLLVMGDYTLKKDKRAIDQRVPLDINKSNFDQVMQGMNLGLDIDVKDKIAGKGDMAVSLKFGTLKDFRPEAVARQVPQLKKLLDMREGLKALKPTMANKDAQDKLAGAIKDQGTRDQILKMVAMPSESGAAGAPAGGSEAPAAGGDAPPAPPAS